MSNPGHESLTQNNYTETPYSDAEWEVVGQPPTEQTFTPVQLEVLNMTQTSVDKMFNDYGGFSSQKGKSARWHLPEDLAASHVGTPEAEEDRIMRMVEEHHAAMEVMEKRSFEQGRKAAIAEMEKKSQEDATLLGTRINGVLADMNRQLDERRDEIERQAVSLAVEIARQLTRATVEFNPEYILPIIKQGLEQAGGALVKSVKVSKEDLEFLTLAGALAGIDGAGTTWNFVADESVKSGCIVETASGEIDLQIEAAFERVKSQVLKAVR